MVRKDGKMLGQQESNAKPCAALERMPHQGYDEACVSCGWACIVQRLPPHLLLAALAATLMDED